MFVSSRTALIGNGSFFATHRPSLMGSVRTISTTRGWPAPQPGFFNRPKEMAAFSAVFSGSPQLSVVVGPPKSGKSALIQKVLEGEAKHRAVACLDLAGHGFSNAQELYSVIQLQLQNPPCAEPAGQESKPPILFIDAANKLYNLFKTDEETVKNLFKWFVHNSTQEQRFHVVLSPCDIFDGDECLFPLWVQAQAGLCHYKTYVIGDLSKEEAERFWKEKIICKYSLQLTPPRFGDPYLTYGKPPRFEDAYSVCGGNISLLEQYNGDYLVHLGGMTPGQFYVVWRERIKITNALRNTEKMPWSREQLLQVMHKLVHSEQGYVVYKELAHLIEESALDALISRGIFHLSPSLKFADDVSEIPKDKFILTAKTPSGLFAMKKTLKSLARRGAIVV